MGMIEREVGFPDFEGLLEKGLGFGSPQRLSPINEDRRETPIVAVILSYRFASPRRLGLDRIYSRCRSRT